MHKIQILIFTGVFLFLGCNMAEAGVFINEIHYDQSSVSQNGHQNDE